MKYVCEKCGRQFDTERKRSRHEETEHNMVAVRRISLWFDNRPASGSRILVGKTFKVEQVWLRSLEPIVSDWPEEMGDMCIVCYPDQVKGALLKLVDAAKKYAQEHIDHWTSARDMVSNACDEVLEKMAKGEIK